MFQPQDQIEDGEDGFKLYDGKPGFLQKGLCVCVVCSSWNEIVCDMHAVWSKC